MRHFGGQGVRFGSPRGHIFVFCIVFVLSSPNTKSVIIMV